MGVKVPIPSVFRFRPLTFCDDDAPLVFSENVTMEVTLSQTEERISVILTPVE